jgi:hypothetical protein
MQKTVHEMGRSWKNKLPHALSAYSDVALARSSDRYDSFNW